jgi:hypothetical protein
MDVRDFFKCQASIDRGEKCLSCEADWQEVPGESGRSLFHTEDCAYLAAERVSQEYDV